MRVFATITWWRISVTNSQVFLFLITRQTTTAADSGDCTPVLYVSVSLSRLSSRMRRHLMRCDPSARAIEWPCWRLLTNFEQKIWQSGDKGSVSCEIEILRRASSASHLSLLYCIQLPSKNVRQTYQAMRLRWRWRWHLSLVQWSARRAVPCRLVRYWSRPSHPQLYRLIASVKTDKMRRLWPGSVQAIKQSITITKVQPKINKCH